jgi:hypothetical protein
MKKLFALFLALILITLVPAAIAKDSRPYICVWGQPGYNRFDGWDNIQVDYQRVSDNFSTLGSFLAEAKNRAGSRPVVVDVEAHGDPSNGLLALQFQAFNELYTNEASVGYVVKECDKYFGKDKNFTLVLESCYGGMCYSRTMHNKAYIEETELHVDSFDKVPSFPIYAISSPLGPEYSPPNYNNTVLLSVIHDCHLMIHDCREDEGKTLHRDDSQVTDLILLTIFRTLDNTKN